MLKKSTISAGLIALICILCTYSASAATIMGNVKYDGDAPKLREIKMDADPICLTHNKEAVLPQTIVLDEDKNMGNIFVHITRGLPRKDFDLPGEAAVITQKGCMYNPHVIGVMAGQPLKILNPDGTLHNVHAMPKINKEFNLAMPKFRKETTKVFDEPEFMFPIKCDVHPWMGAWIAVMEHPFFSVTGKDGNFAIDNLPAGEYVIEAWHEKLGPKKMQVTLAEGETKEIDFSFSRPKKKQAE